MTVEVLTGDCRDVLPTLPERSVQTVITSPPYWNLRAYLPAAHADKAREIGGEESPAAFVQTLVDVFALVHRVLREDGTCWVNIGDSYAANRGYQVPDSKHRDVGNAAAFMPAALGIPPKNLCLIPQRLAIALQDWGWIVRSIIIWSKPNPMPESVQDRPTTAHEYVLLLAKQPTYYYDAVAVAEPSVSDHGSGNGYKRPQRLSYAGRGNDEPYTPQPTRNLRSVWSINTRPYSSGRDDIDHFAVMPEALVERCLLAGSSPQACAQCGSPYRRVTERTAADDRTVLRLRNVGGRTDGYTRTRASGGLPPTTQETTGWQPTCKCACAETKPCVVLDPFAGSGTTLRVATRHGRDAVGIELNPQYIELADERTAGVQMSMESVL